MLECRWSIAQDFKVQNVTHPGRPHAGLLQHAVRFAFQWAQHFSAPASAEPDELAVLAATSARTMPMESAFRASAPCPGAGAWGVDLPGWSRGSERREGGGIQSRVCPCDEGRPTEFELGRLRGTAYRRAPGDANSGADPGSCWREHTDLTHNGMRGLWRC
jgi:hypothetical protein